MDDNSGSASRVADAPSGPAPDNELLIGRDGAAGLVTLNRPRARNALTTAMRSSLADAFPAWTRDPAIYAVIVASADDQAFCAGGDLREMIELGKTDRAAARRSLAAEYALNWLLECFTKPTIALMDGLVVGSGVGISLYGTHRVAGERYRFAMPETSVGLFPDDGVAHAFARMPDAIGMYLALTGRSIGAAAAFRLGLVTHCIPAAQFGEIRAAIAAADPVDPVLDDRHVEPDLGELHEWSSVIARCFSLSSVEGIVRALEGERGATATWARSVVEDLRKRSPTSLKITHRHVRSARALDLRATLQQDYRLGYRCLDGHDLYEGVRAALIDRDQAPIWQPGRLEDVSAESVERYFAALGADDLALPTRVEMQAVKT